MTSLPLDTLQQEILSQEIDGFMQRWTGAETPKNYRHLLQEVENGEVSAECCGTLTGLLEVVLESGRARKLYRPVGENALSSLFQKTPRGTMLAQQTTKVNQALKGLESQRISGITFRSSGPGVWSLTLQTDRCEMNLRIDRQGIQVHTLGVDLG